MRATQHGPSRLAVGLYRVSTAEQGQSGLGLEAQQASVRDFVAAQGWTLVAEFSDVASGKDDRRPGFQAALARCRQLGAVLVAVRLDRITRPAHTAAMPRRRCWAKTGDSGRQQARTALRRPQRAVRRRIRRLTGSPWRWTVCTKRASWGRRRWRGH
jgi:hypothetical protein